MINNYNSFLRKKVIYSIYSSLEGFIQGSTDFIFKLRSLSKSNKIAKRILDAINDEEWIDDPEIKQNYFDVTDKDDKVSFIQQSKVDDLDWDGEQDASFPFTTKGRGEVKIGKIARYIMKLLDEKVKDQEIEEFVNAYKASKIDNQIEFKLIKGKDIAKYYSYDKYYSESGSLGSSCMKEEGKKVFDLYSKNKDKVQLLIYVDDKDKIHGRALVWKLDKSPCESEYFMDRVYSNRDSDEIRFKNFAEEKGFIYKKWMNSQVESNVIFKYKGKDVIGEMSVNLKGDFEQYPFVDTLCFLSEDLKNLSNLPTKGCYFLQSVMGSHDYCDSCKGSCVECNYCYGEEEGDCNSCEPCHNCFSSYDKMEENDPKFNWKEHLGIK
jgi:hypothetical protein